MIADVTIRFRFADAQSRRKSAFEELMAMQNVVVCVQNNSKQHKNCTEMRLIHYLNSR
jgi:hypothetical protein